MIVLRLSLTTETIKYSESAFHVFAEVHCCSVFPLVLRRAASRERHTAQCYALHVSIGRKHEDPLLNQQTEY